MTSDRRDAEAGSRQAGSGPRIISPVPTGSGAYVLHNELSRFLPRYRVQGYSPWWTLFPPAMPLLSRGKVDLVHSAADYGWFFKRRGIPLVVTVHGYTIDAFMKPYSSRLQYLHYRTDLRFFTRRTLAAADCVVGISRFIVERVEQDLNPRSQPRLIYNGVDANRFVPAARGMRQRRPIRILFCGNLRRAKRANLLIPLANLLGPDFEICYTSGPAGRGSLTGNLMPNAARLSDLGRVSHGEMPAVYQSVDLLFAPSAREGFGLCVAEAMACGLPVVAADTSAMPELIDRVLGGYLCPLDDLNCFADAIRQIAAAPEESARMGEHNRAKVESKFTLSRMVDEYRVLFEEVLDGGVTR